MSAPRRSAAWLAYALGVAVLGWGALAAQWSAPRAPLSLGAVIFFGLFSIAIKRLGIQSAPGVGGPRTITHSLVGVVDLAVLFSLGPLAAGLVAALSGIICQVALCRLPGRADRAQRIALPLFGGGLNALTLYLAYQSFLSMGGRAITWRSSWDVLPAVLAACGAHFVCDQLGWLGLETAMNGRAGATAYGQRVLPYAVLIELLPLPTSVLIGAAYTSASEPLFGLMILAILTIGLVLRRMIVLLGEERRHSQELAAVDALSRALLGARLDPGEIGALIYHYCSQVIEAPTFVLVTRDASSGAIGAPLVALAKNDPPAAWKAALLNTALPDALHWLEAHRCALIVGDFRSERAPFTPLAAGEPARSGLYAPLMVGSEMLGMIALQSAQPGAFSAGDQRAVTLIAAQAAMGLHTAQLYREERERSKQLMMIAEVSRKVAAILDLSALFADAVRLVQEAFGYYHVSLFTVDTAIQQVRFQASSNPVIQQRGVGVPWGQGIIGHAAATGDSLLANDVASDSRFLPDAGLEQTRAELALPLKIDRRILGVLDLQSDRAGAFSERDLPVLQTLAAQIAIAIEDSRLYQAQQEQAWVSTALLQAAEAVAQLDTPEEILATTARLTPLLTGVDRALIFIWSEEAGAYEAVECAGLTVAQHELLCGQRLAPEAFPLLERVREGGQTIAVESSELWPYLPPPLQAALGNSAAGQVMALPLRSQGRVIGALVVEKSAAASATAFTGHQQTILTGIANQAALALENARLLAAQREEAWVTAALLQVANTVNSASYDLDDATALVARLAPLLVGVRWCAILLWDEERHAFFASQAHGLPRSTGEQFDGQYFDPDHFPLLARIMLATEPVLLPPLEAGEADAPDDINARVREALGNGAITALPLRSRDRLLGALLAGHAEGQGALSGQRLNILLGIATQTALAIESAQLYRQSVAQERLQREIELARNIQESFLPECCPQYPGWEIGVEWRAARGVGGDYYDFIQLDPQRVGLVVADVSDKGVAAALYMALSRAVTRASALEGRGPAETLRRVNRILLEDARSGMFVSMFYGILDLATGELAYARAGHNPPFWARANGQPIEALLPRGTVLGILDDADLVEERITLEPGDVLVAYTDGVTESFNEKEEEFGEDRLKRMLANAANHTADSLVSLIDAAVRVFTGERQQFDDFTLVVVKRER